MKVDKIDIDKLLNQDIRTLAKAITLIESSLSVDQEEAASMLHKILPHTGKSFRLGITGVPGVGKSTFIENFGLYLIDQGYRVAVLAIDPSSPKSGGSILGDKTRMEELSKNPSAFIRPSPSLGFLGGVTEFTRESILLCEAAGFDFIIVETVGVGQSEFDVCDMVDFFLVLMLPNAGDELQGMKKGILELADAIIINKADGENIKDAQMAMAQYQSALHLMSLNSLWTPRVLTCSALFNLGLKQIDDMLNEYQTLSTFNNTLIENKRLIQKKNWFLKLIQSQLQQKLDANPFLLKNRYDLERKVLEEKMLPVVAANEYLTLVFNHFHEHK